MPADTTTTIAMAATPPAASSHAGRNGTAPPRTESFSKFFEGWIAEQSRDLEELRAAASTAPAAPDADVRRLVGQVLGHYEQYYRTKAAAAADDVLRMFTPSWTSTTENLYLWCGGWRPTAALQLLYTKSGMQLEHQLPNLLNGGSLEANLGDLSAQQMQAADQLHRRTIKREREIEDAAGSAQEALTMAKMVELGGGGGGGDGVGDADQVGRDEEGAGDGGRAAAGDDARGGGAAPPRAGRALPPRRRRAPPRRARLRAPQGRARRRTAAVTRTRAGQLAWLLASRRVIVCTARVLVRSSKRRARMAWLRLARRQACGSSRDEARVV